MTFIQYVVLSIEMSQSNKPFTGYKSADKSLTECKCKGMNMEMKLLRLFPRNLPCLQLSVCCMLVTKNSVHLIVYTHASDSEIALSTKLVKMTNQRLIMGHLQHSKLLTSNKMSAADTREQTLSSVKSNAPMKNTIILDYLMLGQGFI